MTKKDKPKKRIITWSKLDRGGNDTAFAIIDLSIPHDKDVEVGSEPKQDDERQR